MNGISRNSSLVALCVLLAPALALGQVACFNYGGMVSCDGPGGNTIIAPFGPTGGVITQRGEWGSSVTPYTVFEAPKPSRGVGHAIAPLKPLPTLKSDPGRYEAPSVLLPPLLLEPSGIEHYRGAPLPDDLPPLELP